MWNERELRMKVKEGGSRYERERAKRKRLARGRDHFDVDDARCVCLVQESHFVSLGVVADGAVDARLALVKVIRTHCVANHHLHSLVCTATNRNVCTVSYNNNNYIVWCVNVVISYLDSSIASSLLNCVGRRTVSPRMEIS